MTNAEINRLSSPVVRAYLDMEDEILALIGKQLGKDKRLSDTSKWRIRQLARAGEINRRAMEIIASYSEGLNAEIYDALLEAAEGEVGKLDDAMLSLLSEKGSMTNEQMQMMQAFERQSRQDLNVENAKIAGSYAQALTEDCNLVNTVMGYQARSSFVDAVNQIYNEAERQRVLDQMNAGAMSVVSGNESLQEATRKTISRLADNGIPGFIDKAGREWSPEAYVKMDLRSTMGNTARAAQDARCDRYGISLIEVSSHMGARPKCAPYQGRIFSRNGTRGTTIDLNGKIIEYIPLSETSYGEPDGLFGINCGHQQYPFIPGVSLQSYYPYDEEENAERYKEFQQQRALERKIRADKRECMMLQAAGDEEGLRKAAGKLKNDKNKYADFNKQHHLGIHPENTQVYGYDRSKSMKTVWAGKTVAIEGKTQSFKTHLSDTTIVGTRKGKDIQFYSVEGSNYKLFVSEGTGFHKPKELHDIDRRISDTLNAMNINTRDNLPEIFIVTDGEMMTNDAGVYLPAKNQMFLQKGLFGDEETLKAIQADGVFPENPLSTTVHEFYHWQDAQNYTSVYGKIDTEEKYDTYNSYLQKKTKKSIDKAGITEYNVDNISKYAGYSYKNKRYDEVYTEYRTKETLADHKR